MQLTTMNIKEALKKTMIVTKEYVDEEIDKKADVSHGTHLDLGINSDNAYRGDYGNIAYTHSQSDHAPVDAQKNSDITQEEIEEKLTGRIYTHNHNRITFDTNATNSNGTVTDGVTKPVDYDRGMQFSFSENQTNNFNNMTHSVVQTIKPYGSIGKGNVAHQWLYPYKSDEAYRNKVYLRSMLLKDTDWGQWAELYTSLNKPTPADIGAAESSHNHDSQYYTESEINQKLGDISTDIEIAEDSAVKSAKSYTDTAIANLIDSAPAAMDTLKELAKAISDNKGIYDAYITEHAQAMAQMKTDLQNEIDADVKVVADALANEINTQKSGSLAHKINAEQLRAEAIELDFEERIMELESDTKTLKDFKTAHSHTQIESNISTIQLEQEEQFERISALEQFKANHTHDGLQSEINAVKNRVKVFEADGSLDVAAIELRVDDTEVDIQDLQALYNNISTGKADKDHEHTQYIKSTDMSTHLSVHYQEVIKPALNLKQDKSSALALGETSTTAYRGDRGKTAYDHSQATHAPTNAQKNSDITKAEIEAKLTGNITSHTHNQYLTSHQDISGKADKTTVDQLSTEVNTIKNNLGGISFQKLSQSEYDALSTKDPNTLYIII